MSLLNSLAPNDFQKGTSQPASTPRQGYGNTCMYVKVYHLASQDNLESILRKGIYSRFHMERDGNFHDIADHDVLENHRSLLIEGRATERFARCFFNPLPPMYYVRRDTERLCIVELKIPVMEIHKKWKGQDWTFHNIRIAGTRWPHCHMYRQSIATHRGHLRDIEVHSLDLIRWSQSKRAYEESPSKTIAKRGAELLVFEHIPAQYINKVYNGNHEIASLQKYSDLGKPQLNKESL